MPLPPALAARLARRGIIPKEAPKKEEEEVFAESYDDGDDNKVNKKLKSEPTDSKIKYMGYPGCPNKWNVYHECQTYCLNHWKSGKSTPDHDYTSKFNAMMEKYGPLPDEWKQEYDPGTGRHYFWCTRTDRVSWLPPGHPKALITEAASQVREVLQSQVSNLDDIDNDQAMDLDSDMDDSDEDEQEQVQESRQRRDRDSDSRYRSSRDRERDRDRGGRSGDRADPMDPSSYSDAPKGSWSSGLESSRD